MNNPKLHWFMFLSSVLVFGPFLMLDAAESFLVAPPYSNLSISPDGKHIAGVRRDFDGNVTVVVMNTDTQKVDPFSVSNGKGGTTNVSDLLWVGSEWLALMADGDGGANWLHIFNLGKNHPERLAKDGRRELLGSAADSGKFLVAETPSDGSLGSCRLLEYDVMSVEEPRVIYETVSKNFECVLDASGALRLVKKQDENGENLSWYHLPRDGGEEQRLDVLKNWVRIYGVENDSDRAIVAGHIDTALPSIFAFDIAADRTLQVLTDHSTFAIDRYGEVVFDPESGKMVGLQIDATHLSSFWVDGELAVIQKRLDAKLTGSTNRIVGWSEGRKQLLVERIFSVLPAQYLCANLETDEYNPLILNGGAVKLAEVGTTRLVDIPNRGGVVMPSLLTLPPNGFPKSNLPLVVWIRKGIWEDIDRLNWHPEANYLAAEGYAVLRINYRGSSGMLGPLSAETTSVEGIERLFDDIEDGISALVDAKLVDSKRVVIAGEGTGAWAAAYGPIAKPGLFKASVCLNGLYELVAYHDPKRSGEMSGGMYLGFASSDSRLSDSEIAQYSLVRDLGNYVDAVFVTYGKWSPGPHTSQATSFMKSAKKGGASVKLYANDWWGGSMVGSDRIEAFKRCTSFLKNALK